MTFVLDDDNNESNTNSEHRRMAFGSRGVIHAPKKYNQDPNMSENHQLNLTDCPCEGECGNCESHFLNSGCFYGICACNNNGLVVMEDTVCPVGGLVDPLGHGNPLQNVSLTNPFQPPPKGCPVRCECGCPNEELEECLGGQCVCKVDRKPIFPYIKTGKSNVMFVSMEKYHSPCQRPQVHEKTEGFIIAGTMVFILLTIMFIFLILGYILSRKKVARASLPAVVPWIDEMKVLCPQENEIRTARNDNYLISCKSVKEALEEIDLNLILSDSTIKYIQENSIDTSQIQCIEEIGKGNFGKVFRGTWKLGQDEIKEIAVKTPIMCSADRQKLESEIKDFYKEAKLTSKFNHKNILSSIGISKGPDDVPWLLTEFMPYGDLLQILRSNCGIPSMHKKHLPFLSKNDLWHLSFQIAAGMKYLSNQRFTHRDLAARNCLVGKNLELKISDFGLTRDVYTDEYYKMNEHRLVPVRWMAPESIERRVFSSESDVFSFGIVLWEIYTFGKTPYYGWNNHEVATMVPAGLRQSPPAGCPDIISELMMDCWKLQPEARITFEKIYEKLDVGKSMLNQFSNPSYDPNATKTSTNLSAYVELISE